MSYTPLVITREAIAFLYGYYNSEQPLIQVKICTAVDKEKGIENSTILRRQLSFVTLMQFTKSQFLYHIIQR